MEADFDFYYALLKHAKFDDALDLINPKTVSIEMLNDFCFEMARAGQGAQVLSKINRFRNEESIVSAFKEIPYQFDDLTKINNPKGEILFHLSNRDLASAALSIRQLRPESSSNGLNAVETVWIEAVTFLLFRRNVDDAVRLAEGLSPFRDEAIEALAVDATFRLPATANSYGDLLRFINRISQRYPVIAQKTAKTLWSKYDVATFVVSERKASVATELLKYVDSIQAKPNAVPFEFRCDLLDAKYLPLDFRKKLFVECYSVALDDQDDVKNLPANQLIHAACEFELADQAKRLLEKFGGKSDPLLILRVAKLLHEKTEYDESIRLLELIELSNLRRYQREIYIRTLLQMGEMTQVKSLRASEAKQDFQSPKIDLYILGFETDFKNSEAICNFVQSNELKLDGDDFARFVLRGNPVFGATIAQAYVASRMDANALDSIGSTFVELIAQNRIQAAIQFASRLKDSGIEPNFFRIGQSRELRKLPSSVLGSAYFQLRKLFPDNEHLNKCHFELVFDMKKHGQQSSGFEYLGNDLKRKLFWTVCGQIRNGEIERASQAIAANKSNLNDEFFIGWAEEFAMVEEIDEILKTVACISDQKKRAAQLVYLAGALTTERFSGEEMIPLYSFYLDLRNSVYTPFRWE